jgi:hypothetical protein
MESKRQGVKPVILEGILARAGEKSEKRSP